MSTRRRTRSNAPEQRAEGQADEQRRRQHQRHRHGRARTGWPAPSAAVSASATCRLEFWIRLIARSRPALAHRLLDADDVLDRVAGQRDHDEADERLGPARAPPSPAGARRRTSPRRPPRRVAAAARTPIASRSGHASSSAARSPMRPGRPPASTGSRPRRSPAGSTDTNTEISTAWPLSGPPGAVETVGMASAATASTSMIAIVRTGAASNTCLPLLEPAGEEREAEHEQAVAEDRPDQRRSG